MNDLCLISVPHSGTRWCVRLFVDARPKWHEVSLTCPQHQTPHLYHGHCVKRGQTDAAIEHAKRGVPLIMPMRHPYRVEEAWRRRAKSQAELMDSYINLLDHLLPYVDAFLPIDAAPLVQKIAEIKVNDLVGMELNYRWSWIENSQPQSNTSGLELKDCDPSDLIRQVRSHEVFTEFYGSQRDEEEAIERSKYEAVAAQAREDQEARQLPVPDMREADLWTS